MAAKFEPRESSLQVRFISLVWGVIFTGSGLFKVLMLPEQEELFVRVGLPRFLLVVLGVLEVICGGLILSPRWRPWGALAVALEMVIAGVMHLSTGIQTNMVWANAALLVGALYLFFKERSILIPPRRPHAT